MSKAKRSLEEEILHYRKKIQKLEEKIPGTSGGTTVLFAGEYRERESTARSEVPDKRDSRNVSPALDSRPRGDISPVSEARPPHDNPVTEPTRRDIPATDSTRRDIPVTLIQPRSILSTEWRPPRDISPIREARKTPAIIESRRCDSLITSALDPRQLRDMPAAESRNPCDSSPATELRDPPPVALGTPNSPPIVVDEPMVLPQPNLNVTEGNTIDPSISTSTPVHQRATRKTTRKTSDSERGLVENTNEMDRKEALLNALGDDLSLCGEKIHASLAQKWKNILRKGLPIDTKDKLLKEYAAPDNCRLLKAPSLNDEIYTIAEFNSKNRDKILEGKQNQLGLGISAIGKGITVLLNQGESYEVNAMRHFNHGCRLLLDLHHTETSSRRHLFKIELCRSDVFRNLKIQDLERDDTLFGNKVAKMVKKQGIPPTPAHQRPSSSSYGDLPLPPHHMRNDSPRYRRN